MKTPELKVTMMKMEDVKPYPQNVKLHPQGQVDEIAESIIAFGFLEPITVDREGVIVKGHGRYLAMQKLERKVIPAYVSELSDEENRALRLADNKVAESGTDSDVLKIELKEIDVQKVYTGYSPAEIQMILHPVEIKTDDSRGSGDPVISFTIVFDNSEQQDHWFAFVRFLKANGQEGSVAAKIIQFLQDNADF